MKLRELADLVPTGIICAFFNGAAVGGLIGLGAVYAVAVDVLVAAGRLLGRSAVRFGTAAVADRVHLDHVSRRGVMLVVAAVAATMRWRWSPCRRKLGGGLLDGAARGRVVPDAP